MDGLVVILAGVAALGGGILVLRGYGSRFRVGRLLASAPSVTVAEALDIARGGRPAFVRVTGRLDSETDFEDLDHRPLVFRRTRFQARRAGAWTDFDIVREVVPFEVREGLDGIAIDTDALDDGLVVVPRETVGIVGDLGDRAPEDLDDTLPARVVVELVSNVEHATIAGVPALGPDGGPRLGAGLGRPLILTTLEQSEAMRILAGGSSARARAATILLVAAVALVVIGLVMLVLPGSAFAASPDPTAVTGSDTRSSGQGPGLVGAPLAAILGVAGVGILAMVLTLLFVRATGGPRRPDPPG
ncbi:MAG: hypothetical protein HY264_02095 [Chloroflexi bacterium]|nr:hypothetical protein [Chloroflexota bacterium]